jgi:hypothetical protein
MRFLALFILLSLCNYAFATNEAEAYIQAMLAKYQQLTEYEDSGVTRTYFSNPDGHSFTDVEKFTTKFIENDLLHFQWTEKRPFDSEPRIYSVWKDKSGIFSKYPYDDKQEKHSSLDMALSGATGISSGIAWMTPRYLSPEISCKPSLGAQSSEVIRTDPKTIVIKQIHSTGSTSKLYIDKESYLLQKYESYQDLGNGTNAKQTTIFNVINAK